MSSITPITTREQTTALLRTQTSSELLTALSSDILLNLITTMNLDQIAAFSLTCRGVHALVKDDYLWELLFKGRFPDKPPPRMGQGYLESFQKEYILNTNFSKGIYASYTFPDILDSKITSLDIVDNKIICLSREGLTLWIDLDTLECTEAFNLYSAKHQVISSAYTISTATLIASSPDGVISFWDMLQGKCIKSITHQEGVVSCLSASNTKLFLGCEDGMIRVRDLKSEHLECLESLSGHHAKILALAHKENTLVSSSDDSTLRIWDLTTNTSLIIPSLDDGGPISSLIIEGDKLFTGGDEIVIRDLATGEKISSFKERHTNGRTSHMEYLDGKLLSQSNMGEIILWDLETRNCLNKIDAPCPSNACFAFTGSKLILNKEDRHTLSSHRLEIRDYSALDKAIFDQIASELVSENSTVYSNAVDLFMKMPPKARAAIYVEFYKITPYSRCVWEHTKISDHSQLLLDEQTWRKSMAKAIQKYIEKIRGF